MARHRAGKAVRAVHKVRGLPNVVCLVSLAICTRTAQEHMIHGGTKRATFVGRLRHFVSSLGCLLSFL